MSLLRRTTLLLTTAAASLFPCQAHGQGELASSALSPRQVAAPASDIVNGRLRLPHPSAGAVRSRGALFELMWRRVDKGRWEAVVTVPVRAGMVGLAVQSMDASRHAIGLTLGPGRVNQVEGTERRDQVLPAELGGEEVQRLDFRARRSGELEVRVTADSEGQPARARLALRDEQPLNAAAYVDTHELVANAEFGLVAQVERSGDGVVEERLLHGVRNAWAEVEGPGYAARLALRDDGRSRDGAAGDGRFGAVLPKGLSGSYVARVELNGVWGGAEFVRTTQAAFEVSEPSVSLTGAASGVVVDPGRLRLDLGALELGDPGRVQVSAEVWGRDGFGNAQPMTWLSLIQRPRPAETVPGSSRLSLWLDAGWLAETELRPPLELRHVRVQDVRTFNVLSRMDRMGVRSHPSWVALLTLPDRSPTGQALFGLSANAAVSVPMAADISPSIPNPGLVLTHGYCAGSPPWPGADFSQPKLNFSDLSRNRSHDEFANLIASQASSFTSFGVVAHSQGGAAALHLLTFYQSPLDRAQGPRRIQSVGTPYQGTPLASLGFFACGVNNNLTPGGAATWLAGIPSWARAEVSYYTTANDGGACQFLTDLLLSNPEDGTTERSRGQLPGAQNMGHVTGWCHTTGMSDPAQYRDGGRNGIMNAEAAR